MKKFMEEFKAFAMRGNVIDMAVGVIIGGAFKAIADSLVNDIINPPISFLPAAWTDLSGLSFSLPGGGELMLGNFINAILNFLIMAFVVFCIVIAINNMHDKLSSLNQPQNWSRGMNRNQTKEELLLAEIRDLLKEQSK